FSYTSHPPPTPTLFPYTTLFRSVHEATKGERRAARERVSRYYETELAKLIDRVDEAIARYRDGEIGVHDVDDVIHRYSKAARALDRKSTRLNSSHQIISYAVFCL